MNVQEQLCNMSERVNIAIHRWNEIQANCYKALSDTVGAAVSNDVYYHPDEVHYCDGYDEDSGCPYAAVVSRAVDKAGRPIHMRLVTAYGNVGNSGIRQSIEDASFVNSATAIVTAVNPAVMKWEGPALIHGQPMESVISVEGAYIAGWNKNGALRFFIGKNVDNAFLCQNRMVDVVGPVWPCVKDGSVYASGFAALPNKPGAITAIGFVAETGQKVMFSVGMTDAPGMTPTQAAQVLKRLGCSVAVFTSYADGYPATPSETERAADYANLPPDQVNNIASPLGRTSGMLYLGALTTAPINHQIPQNAAFWVISKRPGGGWRNDFTSTVADTVQRLSFVNNNLESLQGKIDSEQERLLNLEGKVTKLEDDMDTAKSDISNLQEGLSKAEQDIETLNGQVAELQAGLEEEREERAREDAALRAAIQKEEQERIAADTALQNQITANKTALDQLEEKHDEDVADLSKRLTDESTARNLADQNLLDAINNERIVRETADAALNTRIDKLELTAAPEILGEEPITVTKGDGTVTIGVKTGDILAKVTAGENVTITQGADGAIVVNSEAGGISAENIKAGDGVTVTDNGDGSITISAAGRELVAGDNITVEITEDDKAKISATGLVKNEDYQADKKAEEDRITAVEEAQENLAEKVENIENGTGLPIASAERLGAIKVGDYLTIDDNGVLSADVKGDKFTVKAPLGTIVAWSGSADDIPTGWKVCDGTENTPDLRGRFILGASDEFAQGTEGGETEVVLTVEEMPEHNHDIRLYNNVNNVSGRIPANGDMAQEVADAMINSGTIQPKGANKAHNNMPPYYALVFIMKTSNDASDVGSGENVAAGNGIAVTHDAETNTATVSLDASVQETLRKADAVGVATPASPGLVKPGAGLTVDDKGALNVNFPAYTGENGIEVTPENIIRELLPTQEITRAEWDALSEAEKNKDVLYVITDDDGAVSSVKENGVPVGTVIAFMGMTAPGNYLVCDGAAISKTEYPALAACFEKQFGSAYYFGGEGDVFNLPDLRNLFLRGAAGESAEKLAGNVGKKQAATQSVGVTQGRDSAGSPCVVGCATAKEGEETAEVKYPDTEVISKVQFKVIPENSEWDSAFGTYTYTSRPVNAAVLYCIKAVPTYEEGNGNNGGVEESKSGNWVVRKYADGYAELFYNADITVTKDMWQTLQSWYWVPNVMANVLYPLELKEVYSETATGNIDIFSVFTGYGMAAHEGGVGAYAFVRPTVPEPESISGKLSAKVCGRWK